MSEILRILHQFINSLPLPLHLIATQQKLLIYPI